MSGDVDLSAFGRLTDGRVLLPAPLRTLRAPTVRDLGWLLFAPALLAGDACAGLLATPVEAADAPATIAWLHALDAAPQALEAAAEPALRGRLGHRAEALLRFFLQHGPAARLVAANLPVRGAAGRTLGECDFLLRTPDGRRLHWELAVKCYLDAGAGATPLARYVGPGLADRFDVKLARLLDHQLPLSSRTEFGAAAAAFGAAPWQAQMCVRGWLFDRWRPDGARRDGGETGVQARAAAGVNPDCPRGFWATLDDWRVLAATLPVDGWVPLPRLEWMAPARVPRARATAADALAAAAVARFAAVPAGEPASLLAVGVRCGDDGAAYEIVRGFIVPAAWPELAMRFAAAA